MLKFLTHTEANLLKRFSVLCCIALGFPALCAAQSSLKFDVLKIETSMHEDDAPKAFVYKFTNTGECQVVIDHLTSTCSCAQASVHPHKVAPGASGEVKVIYNPKGHPGNFERKIFIYTSESTSGDSAKSSNDGSSRNDAKGTPSVVLRLETHVESSSDLTRVYPLQMGKIRLRSVKMRFHSGERSVESLMFLNTSDSPLQLTCAEAFLPENMSFKTVPDVVDPGAEGRIVVTHLPAPIANETVEVPLILQNVGVPPTQATIKLTVVNTTK